MRLRKLQWLDVSSLTNIPSSVLIKISLKCQSITSLILKDCFLLDGFIDQLIHGSAFPSLKRLNLSGNSISSEKIIQIRENWYQLEELDISNSILTLSIDVIEKNHQLYNQALIIKI